MTLERSSDSEQKGFAEGFWSKETVKDVFLDEQREYIYNDDYFRRVLVPLFGLLENSIILDVGCGLGFIGTKLWEFVPKGKVIGVDLDSKLIEEAKRRAGVRGMGNLDFRVGNAYELPAEDNSVDLSICQTLLMHLNEPLKGIAEMKRVTKAGGRIIAIEPDYASFSVFDTAYETMNLNIEDRSKLWRWERTIAAGKKKLGRGDNDIGLKIPYLFFKSGLRLLDVRCLDKVFWLIPPYEGHTLELKHLQMPPDKMIEQLDLKSEFIAGGGTEDEWREYFGLAQKAHEVTTKQIEEKTYVTCYSQVATISIAQKI